MTGLMWGLGIAVFLVGLLFSIAWHELGHLSTAKLFKIRVPQYMVGFGPTIWSRHKGETEYGVKAIPLGGYIRMIGMFPPGDDGRIAARSTSPFRGMIEDARSAAYEELKPGDETRMFYTRKPWKRVIVMFAGPFMNLILAFGLFLALFMGFGIPTQTTTVGSVSDCVVPASDTKALKAKNPCALGDYPDAPAKAAGLRQRDRIVAFNGVKVDDSQWTVLQQEIRKTIGPATITVVRDGKTVDLHATLIANTVVKTDGHGGIVKDQYVQAGFLGFTPAEGVVKFDFGQSIDHMATTAEEGARSLVALPGKIPGLWNAVFSGAERQPDSPVGMIGAARLGGDIFALPLPATQKVATMVNVLAGVNLALFLFNMLPLLPLDGGHIAGALWESVRRRIAKVLRRADPGPFDVAKLMPAAYVVAGIFICFTALVMAADLINPVRLT
ncbi:M50 family metallopeptidase [Actinacidiphila sp. bgisy160]|uniref:M50 family metallopeptidase n=1 Tax=Actinacidiphila sp. bgisy160 TaxID=3413796 RepID=UPI003D71FDCF